MQALADVIRKVPGVAETIVIGGSGSSPIDSSSSLFNSGVIYAVLKPSRNAAAPRTSTPSTAT